MTEYNDGYICGPDLAALEKFASAFASYIPPQPGRAAHSYSDESGATVTVPPAGDPALYYTCVRAAGPVVPSLTPPLAAADAATAASLVGIFA